MKSEDTKWLAVCKIVDKRDTSDRLLRVLTPGEARILKSKTRRLDRCHIFARSIRPDLIYNPKNIVKVNHQSHLWLDNCQCPLTGENITANIRDWWWWRILTRTTEKYNEELEYSSLLDDLI